MRCAPAAIFALALAIGLALLSLAGWAMLRGFRWFLRRAGARLPGIVRHGMANLYRPGNQAQAAVVALGVGVMFTLTVFLVQNALVEQIRGSAPPGMPNVFLLDIPANQRLALSDFIRQQPGVKEAPDVAFAVAARITAIDGKPIDNLPLRDFNRRFLRTRSVTAMDAMPADTVILNGAWWRPGDRDPQVCVNEEAAKILNLKPGMVVDWNIWNHNLRTRVACIQRTESIRMTARFEFIFNPGQLENFPAVYYGSARVRPADVPAMQRVVYQKFPTVTVVNVADVMQIVEDVVQRIALVIRFISGVHHFGRRGDGGIERGRHAVPPHARGGDAENAGRHAAAHRVDLLGGVSGAGHGGGTDGQPAGRRVRGAGAQTPAADRLSSGTCDAGDSRWQRPRWWPRSPDGRRVSASWAGNRWRSCATNRRRCLLP